jgi:hypothetical protein
MGVANSTGRNKVAKDELRDDDDATKIRYAEESRERGVDPVLQAPCF